ncbi:MAG: cell surface protein SprA, partial [Bacteroidia bacterium]
DTKQFEMTQKMGNLDYRTPTYMTEEEYQDYMFKKQVRSYWKSRIQADDINAPNKQLIPKLTVGGEMFDRIFGGNTVDIRPQGSAELIFGLVINKNQNPALPVKQRRISNFDFNMKVQLNLVGKIGEKLKLTTNYNTEASFDFENQMKLEYNGLEDEILKKIEAGNVSLPLNSSLITGSQSLFGVKTQMQFGRLTATTVLSQQRGKKTEVTVQGGSQTTPYQLNADNYEANRHYFLSQFFRSNYNQWMSSVPIINSPVVVTKIEVYITNRTQQVDQARNVVAFADLGEDTSKIIPQLWTQGGCAMPGFEIQDLVPGNNIAQNGANNLYSLVADPTTGIMGDRNFAAASLRLTNNTTMANSCNSGFKFMENGRDFEVLARARKLTTSEYTLNQRLGFISLNQALNFDEVLAVSFQYTYNGQTYQVGEFSDQFPNGDQALFLKMLKSTQLNTKVGMWDLMMKNVYSIGAYQINSQDFKLDIYRNTKGVDQAYIAHNPIDGKLLIQVMNLDRINVNGDKIPDGYFDFVPGVTINPNTGRVYFPSIEPFGNDLKAAFNGDPDPAIKDFIFQELYDSTKISAQQLTKKNVYKFKGSYKSSSSSEISLNAMNIPQGSVTVSAGGVPLTENVDYTVDYTLGRVKIINESILNSGQPIKVSSENNSLFNIQQKSLVGTRLDYKVSNDLTFGGTFLHLTERPLTQKVNIGDEPVSNTIWGTDFNYRTDAPWLTRFVDKIPLINTKEKSSIQTAGEFAELIPGHSKAIGKSGNSYIDDFEGSISMIDLRSQGAWFLASVPQGQDATSTNLFPEASLDSTLSGFNRARMAWYTIDQSVFYQQQSGLTPNNITKAIQSNHYMRRIIETEIFPNKQPPNGQPVLLPVLDIAFYPDERGPYNYNVKPTSFAAGIDFPKSLQKGDVRLNSPETRWGGIMRRLETNDFQTANIEFIQFWMMDPFNEDYDNTFTGYVKPTDGEMYINLGNCSEDLLKDGRMSFENGLPTPQQPNLVVDQTQWGNVPAIIPITNAFGLEESERAYQDVGYDGLKDDDERSFFNINYLNEIASVDPTVYGYASTDPSADDYHFYRGDDYDQDTRANTLFRYKQFNGTEGNSPTESQYSSLNSSGYPTQASTIPNIEDINRDNTLSETEAYYQYKIKITPQDINPQNVGNNYITNAYESTAPTADGGQRNVWWYQFKVPIAEGEKIGTIEGFNSIRFMRMFMKNFSAPVVCRMARLELVRSDWRRYQYDLGQAGDYIAIDNDQTSFDISSVNIQENGTRTPVNYVIPPGINQQQNVQTTNLVLLNEQALVLRTCGLKDGQSRAAYKNIDYDVRSFKKMKMFVHAEKYGSTPLADGELTVFMRIGTDFNTNYYEYEVPLKLTQPGYYDPNNDADREAVWLPDDEIVI